MIRKNISHTGSIASLRIIWIFWRSWCIRLGNLDRLVFITDVTVLANDLSILIQGFKDDGWSFRTAPPA